MENRRLQMKWLIALTALSLMPVYGLLGWQTGPHGAKEVWALIWIIESVAWSLRALIEAWALVYLFTTNTQDSKAINTLHWIEGALIGLIGITVTLLIVANKNNQSINELWAPLFWLWAVSVASFAPLMFAGVGIAYRVHIESTEKIREVRIEVPILKPDFMNPILRWPEPGNTITYFIQGNDSDLVKIGKTSDLKGRLSSLQSSIPQPIIVAGFVEGDRENELHRQFSSDNVFGEWYKLSDDLKLFILEQAQPPITIDEDENNSETSIKPPVVPIKPIDQRRQQVKNLHGEGLNQTQMAEQLKVSLGTINNDLKILGLNGK